MKYFQYYKGEKIETPLKMTTTSSDHSQHDITCPEYLKFSGIYQLPSHNYIERRLYSADHRNLGIFCRDTKLTEEPGEPQGFFQEPMNILSYSDVLCENKYPLGHPQQCPNPAAKGTGRLGEEQRLQKRLGEYLRETWTLSCPQSDVVLLFSVILHGFLFLWICPIPSNPLFATFLFWNKYEQIGWSSLCPVYCIWGLSLSGESQKRRGVWWEALLIPSTPV